MQHELNKLKKLLKTSIEKPNPSVCGWLQGTMDGPNPDKFYIYVPDRKTAIEYNNQLELIWKKDQSIYNNISLDWFKKELRYLFRIKMENEDYIFYHGISQLIFGNII